MPREPWISTNSHKSSLVVLIFLVELVKVQFDQGSLNSKMDVSQSIKHLITKILSVGLVWGRIEPKKAKRLEKMFVNRGKIQVRPFKVRGLI